MAIQWKDSLATGVQEIDNQHKELFDAINKLFDACSQGKGKEEVDKVIKFLGDYVVLHFGAEEKLQKKFSYPEYNAHKEQHEKFISDFLELKKQIDTEGANARSVILINRVVVDWLIKHIGVSDKKLGVFLKDKI